MPDASCRSAGPGGWWAITSGLAAAAANLVLHGSGWPAWFRVTCAVAPAIPLAVYCVLAIRGVHRLDELQTRIQLEAGLIAFFSTLWGLVVVGLLATGGLLPDWPLTEVWPWVWVGWAVLWAGSGWVVGRRYR
jgi:hypothetical protein